MMSDGASRRHSSSGFLIQKKNGGALRCHKIQKAEAHAARAPQLFGLMTRGQCILEYFQGAMDA